MKEVVISQCFGGFGLSGEAFVEWGRRKGKVITAWVNPSIDFKTYEPATPEEMASSLFVYYRDGSESISDSNIARDDADLVAIVKEWGSEKASSRFAKLVVVELPADVQWEVEEYDGYEHIAEKHRVWP